MSEPAMQLQRQRKNIAAITLFIFFIESSEMEERTSLPTNTIPTTFQPLLWRTNSNTTPFA
jgi:hypothetical protein